MHRHGLNGLLLRPSMLSTTVCGMFAVAVPIAVNWSYLLKNSSIYGYFFGPNGVVAVIHSSAATPVLGTAVNNKALVHNLSILAGAIAVAVGLYIALHIIIRIVSGISFTIKEVTAQETPAKHMVEQEIVERTAIRALTIAIWAFYVYVSVKVILPFSVLSSQLALNGQAKLVEGIGYILFAVSMLFFAGHLHVVLARLLFLRARVFGNEVAILNE